MKKTLLLLVKALRFSQLSFKKPNLLPLIFGVLLILSGSCKKDQLIPAEGNEQKIIAKLKAAGFNLSQGFAKYKNGYIVEYDIFITEDQIDNLSKELKVDVSPNESGRKPRMGSGSQDPTSHYITNDLVYVGSSRRTISIYMDPSFGTYLQGAFDDAIARFNSLDLSLQFTRATSASANIIISPSYVDPTVNPTTAYLGLAGFPYGEGSPYSQIYLNTYYFNSSSNRYDATTVIAHEIGHTIGFRHTDYMNRSFSCGTGGSESSDNIGANNVTGTSTGPSADSWMLACSNGGDRPFTGEDVLALKMIYSYDKGIYIKQIYTLVYDNSYYTWLNDYDKLQYNVTLEFYQDPSGTIPYTTTSNGLLLNLVYYWGGVPQSVPIILNSGLTGYDLGAFTVDVERENGNVTLDNSNGYTLSTHPSYTRL